MSWTCPACKESNHDDMRICACGYDAERPVEKRAEPPADAPVVIGQGRKGKYRDNKNERKLPGTAVASKDNHDQIGVERLPETPDARTWFKLNSGLVGWGAAGIIALGLLLASGFKALPFMLFVAVAIMLIVRLLDAIKVRDAWIGFCTAAFVCLGLLLSWKYVADVFQYKPGRIVPQYFTSSMAPSGIGTRQTGYEFEIGVSGQGLGTLIDRSLARLTHDRIYRLFDDRAIDELKKYPDDPRVKEYFRKIDEVNEDGRQKKDADSAARMKAERRQELVRQIEQYKKAKKWPALVRSLEKEVARIDAETGKNPKGEQR